MIELGPRRLGAGAPLRAVASHHRTGPVPTRDVRYELWETRAGSLVPGEYATEAEALAVVRETVAAHGREAVASWRLVRVWTVTTERRTQSAGGAALAERALAAGQP